MALETATNISGLVSSNPVSTDAISAADDHIRLLKATILATFPNITGAMNATHTELNTVADGGTAATSTTLVDADRMVVNDDGTMVQVAMSDLITYLGTALTSAGALATINSGGNAVSISGLSYPSADGSAGQFLKTDGSGTLSFATQTEFSMPAGMMFPYAGSSVPTGYLFCHGQAISRTTYADLFTAIGTTYGTGDGSSTFNLPDLRGRVIAGQDDMGGSSANRLTDQSGGLNGDTLGATGGAETHDLQLTEIPGHNHASGTLSTGLTVAVTTGGTVSSLGTSTSGNLTQIQPVSGNTASAGGGNAHNNVQPTIILNYVIKT